MFPTKVRLLSGGCVSSVYDQIAFRQVIQSSCLANICQLKQADEST